MDHPISDIAFTPAVKAAQEERGSRSAYAKMEQRGGWNDVVTPELAEFIAARDSLYLGTTGMPPTVSPTFSIEAGRRAF